MKAINLFVDFEFTSLSPDAQPISVGIVSEEYFNEQYRQLYTDKVEIKKGNCSIDHLTTKSFYAEFSDFDINRCDEWVRENVVGKLEMRDGYKMGKRISETNPHQTNVLYGTTDNIKKGLYFWLKQFSDYQITFVVDCGTWDWWFLMQLLAEWENVSIDDSVCPFCGDDGYYGSGLHEYKTGIPKLLSNISPVPFELNQFIAEKKGISVREAFDLNREELACDAENSMMKEKKIKEYRYFSGKEWSEDNQKHNALFDARVMKAIYEKLK
jgi:hypothetical protein